MPPNVLASAPRCRGPHANLRRYWLWHRDRGTSPPPVWGVLRAGELLWWSVNRTDAERHADRVGADVHPVAPVVRYRRAPGPAPRYIVIDPWTGNESAPMRRAEAWPQMRRLGGKHARIVELPHPSTENTHHEHD